MRIVFVAASLEPGRDGVGDYTRDLAAACIRRGHDCALVGLHEQAITNTKIQSQSVRGQSVDTLRLSATTDWSKRLFQTREWIGPKPVDWLSLQFVPYGFNPKGLTYRLARRLAAWTSIAQRTHLMLHELWVGAEAGASLRHRAVGWAQQRGVLKLVEQFAPSLVHTSNAQYQTLLAGSGISARVLPLCGSIPVVAAAGQTAFERELRGLEIGTDHALPRGDCWWFGMFGSLHPSWQPEPLFSHFAQAASRVGRRVVIASIGRLGPGQELWEALKSRYQSRFAFAMLGERPATDISLFLQNMDFGIATTPWGLVHKSAAVAAMLDHGLPVIVSRNDVRFRSEPRRAMQEEPLLRKLDAQLPEWLCHPPARRPPRERITDMADRFVRDLSGFAP